MPSITNLDSVHDPKNPGDYPTYHASIASFERPDNTTAYTVGDVVSDSASVARVIEFPKCAKERGGSGVLVYATLAVDDNYATIPAFHLYLFTAAPTDHLDNAPMALADADLPKMLGVVDFPQDLGRIVNATAAPAGALFFSPNLDWEKPFLCADTDRSLYGLLRVVNAAGIAAPASGDKFTIRLGLRVP